MAGNENDLDARSIITSRVFDAPRALVFETFTNPKHVSNWWGPRGFTTTTQEMDVRPGGQWIFVMHGPDGTDYYNEIVYLEVVQPERLVYTHGPAPIFDATITFEEEGGKTRVTLRTTFVSAEVRNQVVDDFGAIEGAKQTLERFGEELERQRGEFSISRRLDAPRDLVFRVWTDCEHLEHWWGPKDWEIVSCRNDLRPGGVMHYGMRAADGSEMWGRWVYREIAAPSRLVFINSFSDTEGGLARPPFEDEWPSEMLTTVAFDEENGGTLVTVRSSPYDASDAERATFHANHDSMRGGWTGTFEKLDDYLGKAK